MSNFNIILETERLILRPFTMDDVEPSYLINLVPEVTRYTHDGGVKTKQEIHDILIEVIQGDYVKYGFGRFAVVDKKSNQFIGFSGLKYLPEYDFVDIGYRFQKSFWGRGIATETCNACLKFGFDTLKLDKIYGMALLDNTASIRVMEKLGFKFDNSFIDEGETINQYLIDSEMYYSHKEF